MWTKHHGHHFTLQYKIKLTFLLQIVIQLWSTVTAFPETHMDNFEAVIAPLFKDLYGKFYGQPSLCGKTHSVDEESEQGADEDSTYKRGSIY